MSIKNGLTSLVYESLKLQIDTIFDDCGGEKALRLLDALAELTPENQEKTLDHLIAVVENVQKSSATPYHLQEEKLLREILKDITDEEFKNSSSITSNNIVHFKHK